MRWLKFGIFIIVLFLAVYSVSMLFVPKDKSFTIRKEIDYPIEKVYPQFSDLQNFVAWNEFFAGKEKVDYDFFTPYEGQGSSMNYRDEKNSANSGELFIRYANPNHTLRYQLFQGKGNNPYLIDIKFNKIDANRTETVWFIHTPALPFLKRAYNLISEDYIAGTITKSMANLKSIMGNKVDKESQMAQIKYDSLMVENLPGQIVLGINVTTQNKADNLFKNIVQSHNKVKNFIQMDLGKKDDEYGMPMLITDPGNYKDKEVSYYYGFPLSKRVGISDNNFSFRTLNASKAYTLYYKGNFGGRIRPIQQLLLKAKRDTMRNGELIETFLEDPNEGEDCVMKISLPVYR